MKSRKKTDSDSANEKNKSPEEKKLIAELEDLIEHNEIQAGVFKKMLSNLRDIINSKS